MIQQKKGLGRGLDSLITPGPVTASLSETTGEAFKETASIPIDSIVPNRHQPRIQFDEESLQELAISIKREGVLQPLLVAKGVDGRYELVAGERRWRAAKMAGLTQVPVIVHDISEEKMLELAMVENIQREDLNAIDEAKGYQMLTERFQLGHADIAERVGKSREYVANALRLLKLPKVIQEDVASKKMSASHARSLLALPSLEDQLYFREKILEGVMSVRDVEQMIRMKAGIVKNKRARHKKHLSEQIKLLLDELQKSLGTKVRIYPGAQGDKGQLVIEYYSWQDLDRIYRRLIS